MMKTTNLILTVLVLGVVVAGGYFLFLASPDNPRSPFDNPSDATEEMTDQGEELTDEMTDNENPEDEQINNVQPVATIGTSVEGRDIRAYRFGNPQESNTELLFVGGIHGGYSPSTSALSYRLIDWLEDNPEVIPENVSVTVIPVLNPDGLAEVVENIGPSQVFNITDSREERISARFNAHGVDLNRNFACNWQPEAQWSGQPVDSGDSAFSEPESSALRDYVQENDPTAVMVYYAAPGAVYSSSCNQPPLPEATEIMNVYADASGYPARGDFDAYPISGDATNWLAKQNIPAISVLLETYTSPEWEKNRAGIEAIFEHYSN